MLTNKNINLLGIKSTKKWIIFIILVEILLYVSPVYSHQKRGDNLKGATKNEREFILKGNKFYRENKFKEALDNYQKALNSNIESSVAAFNSAITEIRMAANMQGNDSVAAQLVNQASDLLQRVGSKDDRRNNISAKAWYNLGNLAFMNEDYSNAINLYKSALRLNPSDNDARRNLRIAQKKQKNNNNDKNQSQQNQQNQEKQDKNKNRNPQNNQQSPKQDQKLDKQTSDRILNAIERKENQTRIKKIGAPEQSSPRAGRSYKNW